MDKRWKPNVTVAAIMERGGRYLLVEEHTSAGLRLNNAAGHLDPGESLIEACAREALEETAHPFEPLGVVGIYMSRAAVQQANGRVVDTTYLRFAFHGRVGALDPERRLDKGIVRALWLTPDEIRASAARHRNPAVLRGLEDHLAGRFHPLSLIDTHASVWQAPVS